MSELSEALREFADIDEAEGGNPYVIATERKAADRLDELEVSSEWRPIETAPKGDVWVLLCGGQIDYGWDGGDAPYCVVGRSVTELNGQQVLPYWQFASYDGGYYGEYETPTHWMPLPAPL